VEYVKPPPPWEAGRQGILNALEAQVPQHTFGQPVPVVVRIVWEPDGEDQFETVALGWTGRHCTCGCQTGGTGSRHAGWTPRMFGDANTHLADSV
jgi:hypothetical protein